MLYIKNQLIIGIYIIVSCSVFLLPACSSKGERSLLVTVTAYNSVPEQTDSTPNITYWDDVLKPGMRAIAVSPDLIKRGLTHGMKVRIEGLQGEYEVLDRTNKRFRIHRRNRKRGNFQQSARNNLFRRHSLCLG